MSNHLAVATVTAALKQLVQNALDDDIPGAKAQVGRPTPAEADAVPTVNLFLYHVMPNRHARNDHLPARGRDGSLRGPGVVALDLYYLISFYGTGSDYAPERLLATVTRAFEHRPILTRGLIEKAIEESAGALDAADLQRAAEPVRLIPTGLSLDELSKLWSVLLQVPYILSVAYKAEKVLVETAEAGSPGPPVTAVGVGTLLIGGPAIDAVETALGPGMPIVWGGTLVLKGRGLDRPDLLLQVGGQPADLSLAIRSAHRLELPLSAAALGGAELQAGAVPVETLLPPPPDTPAHLRRTTDRAVFTLRPRLSLPAGAVTAAGPPPPLAEGAIKVAFAPPIARRQRVELLLDERAAVSPQSWQLTPEPLADADFPAAELTFRFTGVRRADYHLQARVDGVTSAPEIDGNPDSPTFRQISGPTVTVP